MKRFSSVQILYIDLGGVLLTNGWDRKSRQLAITTFGLEADASTIEERNRLIYDTYELGKMTLDEYLSYTYFSKKRSFSIEQFKSFMLAQSQPFSEMIAFITKLKATYHLKIAAISNEGKEVTAYRVETFGLGEFIDFFIVSCHVHMRKPDLDIYRLALDVAQVHPQQALYIDDRHPYIDVVNQIGLNGIHHTSLESTQQTLNSILVGPEKDKKML